MSDESYLTNEHRWQRWEEVIKGVPNVRPAVKNTLLQLGQGIRCIEVGVAEGVNAKAILDLLQPSLLTLVDLWEDVVVQQGRNHPGDRYYAASYEKCRLLLDFPQCEYMRGRSEEILPTLPADSYDFAYIDAAHDPQSVATDTRNCIRLVRIGGIVGGDDYAITEPLQMIALGVKQALGSLQSVKQDGYDWWVTVTPEIKELINV